MGKTNCKVRGRAAEFLGFTIDKDGNPVVAVRFEDSGLYLSLDHPKYVEMDSETGPLTVASAYGAFNAMVEAGKLALGTLTIHAIAAHLTEGEDRAAEEMERNAKILRDALIMAGAKLSTPKCAGCGEYWPCADSQRTDIRPELRAAHRV